ncbi:MAG: hypothetical protein AAF587_12140 [Bacteroidota bacterium]
MNSSHIDNLVEHGYEFSLGDYLNRGWELVRQEIGSYVGFTAIVFFGALIISLIPFVGSLALMIVGPPLYAGYFIYTRKVATGEERTFNDFFSGFDMTLQLVLLGIVGGILIGFGFLLLIIPGIYLAVAYTLGNQLIIFEKMEFWPALEASRKIVTKNWGNFFLMSIVLGLIALAGTLVLFVGLLVAIPFMYCVMYAAYEDIVGFSGSDMMDKIEEIGMEAEEDLFEGLEE